MADRDVTALVIPDGHVRGHIRQGRDYTEAGEFVHGPKRAVPCTVRLMAESQATDRRDDGVIAPAPHVARAQQRARLADRRRVLERHQRFLAAVAGQNVGRNRKAA